MKSTNFKSYLKTALLLFSSYLLILLTMVLFYK